MKQPLAAGCRDFRRWTGLAPPERLQGRVAGAGVAVAGARLKPCNAAASVGKRCAKSAGSTAWLGALRWKVRVVIIGESL